jgi:hypothetical protein
MVQKSRWPQDRMPRPVTMSTASEDPALRALDKAQYVYSWNFALSATASQITKSFQIDQTSNFVISTINAISFVDSTQAGGGLPGFLTLRDDVTKFRFVDNVAMALFATNSSSGPSYRRSMWPLPYPIGAGGSFTAMIRFPTSTVVASTGFITIDGWKDYTLGQDGEEQPWMA